MVLSCGLKYDRYLVFSKIMVVVYFDFNLNYILNLSIKIYLGIGMECFFGVMEWVLKVFYYFESNSELIIWVSIIRYGDVIDVRGII